MGVLATLAAALFPDYYPDGVTPFSPPVANIRQLATAVDNAIPNAQDLGAEISRAEAAEAAEISARQQADQGLQGQVTQEISDRKAADGANTNALATEARARTAADTTLQVGLDAATAALETEGTARGDGDAANAATIAKEAAARGLAIDGLQASLTQQGQSLEDGLTAQDQALREMFASSLAATTETFDTALATVAGSVPLCFRPGDMPGAFTDDLAAGVPGIPSNGVIVTGQRGPVLRVTGGAVLAPARICPIEPNRLYKVRFVVSRVYDTDDPSGDGVALWMAWYGPDGRLLGVPSTSVAVVALTQAMGRRQFVAVVALLPPDPSVLPAPEGATGFRPVVQTYGATPVTDIEVISCADVTDANVVSINVDDLADRLSAVEASQAVLPAAVLADTLFDALIFG